MKYKKYGKVRDHCHYTSQYRGAAHSIYNSRYSVPKEISYDYHFIVNELTEEFEKQSTCLEENTEK